MFYSMTCAEKPVRVRSVRPFLFTFVTMRKTMTAIQAVWGFYRDGFRQMTWGRTLWCIILIKLFILFVILRVFFFKPALQGLDEAQKSERVGSRLGVPG